jgi:hypothetical protein
MYTTTGKRLILETEIYWDDPSKKKDLRVIVSVWDPAPSSAATLVYDDQITHEDFVRAPDGSFVDE